MAMLRQVGCPTFFFTLSAAETKWEELIVILKKVLDNETITVAEAKNMPYLQRADLIRRDPVTCAQYFENRVRAVFALLKTEGSPFAPYTLDDFYIRVEFQHRGSPHVHCLLWLKNAPKYDLTNPASIEECIRFINTYISCSKDDAETTLLEYQTHKHTFACKRMVNGRAVCRFGFPVPPMSETRILRPLGEGEKTEELKARAKRIQAHLETMGRSTQESTLNFYEFLEELQLTEDEYLQAIRVPLKSSKIFLRRAPNEIKINAYNPSMMKLYKANMDIQFVLDPYACIAYILNYINKANRGMSKLMRQIIAETRQGNLTHKERCRVICNKFVNAVEISAQEATYYILGLSVSRCSRKVVFINTSPSEERVRMVRADEELRQLDPEDTNVLSSNYLNYYAVRHTDLENISLAEIVARYELKFPPRANAAANRDEPDDDEEGNNDVLGNFGDNDGDNDENNEERADGRNFPMRGRRGSHRLRDTLKVIRYRRYLREQDEANFFREQLMLFYPWRNEETELININHEQVYYDNLEAIQTVRQMFIPDDNEVDLDAILQDAQNQVNANDDEQEEPPEDAQIQAPENQIRNEFAILLPRNSQREVDIFHQMGVELAPNRVERFVSPGNIPHSEYLTKMAMLNQRQRMFTMEVLRRAKRGDTFYLYLKGGAGYGKSVLVNAIYYSLNHYYSHLRENDDGSSMKVLLCAPTGRAAFNIGGMTLHGAFKLPVNQNRGPLPRLAQGVANTLRARLKDIKVIIIDEISMVGARMLAQVDVRLKQIFGTDQLYGGISIIAVGDFNQLQPVGDR